MKNRRREGEDEPSLNSADFSANNIFGSPSRIPFFDALVNQVVREDQ